MGSSVSWDYDSELAPVYDIELDFSGEDYANIQYVTGELDHYGELCMPYDKDGNELKNMWYTFYDGSTLYYEYCSFAGGEARVRTLKTTGYDARSRREYGMLTVDVLLCKNSLDTGDSIYRLCDKEDSISVIFFNGESYTSYRVEVPCERLWDDCSFEILLPVGPYAVMLDELPYEPAWKNYGTNVYVREESTAYVEICALGENNTYEKLSTNVQESVQLADAGIIGVAGALLAGLMLFGKRGGK